MTTVLEHLKLKKQDNEFTIDGDGFIRLMGGSYARDKIRMIKPYHFEEEIDPDEKAIIYFIQTEDGAIGYSIDTYGAYAIR